MSERNVLGGPLEECGADPVTGYFRDGACIAGAGEPARHSVCAVMTTEFLAHEKAVGNDLTRPRPEFMFPGLQAGDRWCVIAERWLDAYRDHVAPPVVLAATNERALEVVPMLALHELAVDVPDDPGSLTG